MCAAGRQDVEFRFRMAEDVPPLRGDTGRIKQVRAAPRHESWTLLSRSRWRAAHRHESWTLLSRSRWRAAPREGGSLVRADQAGLDGACEPAWEVPAGPGARGGWSHGAFCGPIPPPLR